MDRCMYILKIFQNIKEELKSLLTDELKQRDPDTYYKLASIINKYWGKNPYEDDIDHDYIRK